MFKALFFVLAVSTFLSIGSQAAQGSFAPENGMWIGADDKAAGGITEEQFNKTIDRLNVIYSPIVKAKKAKLVFERNWDDGTVNAYASQSGKTWTVAMFGGLARYDIMTPDGFGFVVCHELSHHLGGAPKIVRLGSTSWATNEGQADYIGAMKCMRELFKKDDNVSIVKTMKVDTIVTQKCNLVYKDPALAAICIRTSMAGKVLAEVLNRLAEGQTPVSFTTPDTHVVSSTDDSHPEAQCRLDTYFAGALCDKDLGQKLSDKDVLVGTCNSSQGLKIGIRPLCWFKPGKAK